jgi:hypothetical protein
MSSNYALLTMKHLESPPDFGQIDVVSVRELKISMQ